MMVLSNVLNLLANNYNIKYRDYIALLPKRNSFVDAWHYSMEKDIRYIYVLGLNIFKITDNITKQIKDYLVEHNVRYYIDKMLDDVILTMYPRKIDVIDFVIGILESNNIEYEFEDNFSDLLDKIELAPVNCSYGIIINPNLQSLIENILQSLNIKYSILDGDENIIKE